MGQQRNSSEAVLYDFGVPQRLGREATDGLRRIHEAVARDLGLVFGLLLEHDVRGSVVSLEQFHYQQFIDRLPPLAYHAVVSSTALDGHFTLVLPGSTSHRLLGCILNAPPGPERGLTLVDARLIEEHVPKILDAIEGAFRPYHPLGLGFTHSELNSQLVKLVPGEDVVVIIEMLFTYDEDDISVILCYPQEAMVPILESLSDIEREVTEEALVRHSPIRQSILRVPIDVTMQLPSSRMPAGDLDRLEVGDVLQMGVPAESPPLLMIAGRPALAVRPTTVRTRLGCTVLGEAPQHTKGMPS